MDIIDLIVPILLFGGAAVAASCFVIFFYAVVNKHAFYRRNKSEGVAEGAAVETKTRHK